MGYKLIVSIALSSILLGCAPARLTVSSSPVADLKTIALYPNRGLLGDAIGLELVKYGFDVFDTAQVSSMMIRLNLTEIEILEPRNIRKLKEEGIDGLLQVRTVSGYDRHPQSISVKVISSDTGKIIIGATWQNGFGGASGSIADRVVRSDVTDAAEDIAKGIYRHD
ncbi:MAG: hypothetical protein OEZ68_02395 [Gammaproteobacteria bacterium]|nr:hypothetical protein [Gammaproteobacteria bacterium]MDH5799632.1 hypothetical protein [Gammaproteobacteria bacterium]